MAHEPEIAQQFSHVHARIDSVVRDMDALHPVDQGDVGVLQAEITALKAGLERLAGLELADIQRLQALVAVGHAHDEYAKAEHAHDYAYPQHPHDDYAKADHDHAGLTRRGEDVAARVRVVSDRLTDEAALSAELARTVAAGETATQGRLDDQDAEIRLLTARLLALETRPHDVPANLEQRLTMLSVVDLSTGDRLDSLWDAFKDMQNAVNQELARVRDQVNALERRGEHRHTLRVTAKWAECTDAACGQRFRIEAD